MARIAVLSETLVNKIAAGEVVERPASVVKELCENALDAGATSIRVALEEGGLGLITITDDGCGMSREDAQLCLERHATSKLQNLEGLFHITTLGFRGEALPSIASVSRFTLRTCERGAPVGTAIHTEGGSNPVVEDAPPVEGTTIRVEDLFFNTPARRKFLRRSDTEMKHCQEAVIRLALAHPQVGFHVDHGGHALLSSGPCLGDPRERIAAALGAEVHAHLLPVEERRLGVTVRGHVASPEFTMSTARGIYTFVNRRYIRDRGLNHAIQRAFSDALPSGRQPVAVLFIEVEPSEVDVNVHPQKMEVRFADVQGVYDAVYQGLVRALRSAPWLRPAASAPKGIEPAAHYAMAVEQFLTRAQQQVGWGALAPLPMSRASDAPASVPALPGVPPMPPAFGQARPGINEAPPPGYFASLRLLGTLGRRFCICEGPGGTLVVLDPHAAIERSRLSSLRRQLEKGELASAQAALFTATVELTPVDTAVVVARQRGLQRLGLEIEPFGGSTLALKSMPAMLAEAEPAQFLPEVARALPEDAAIEAPATFDPALRIMACHAAGEANRELSNDELAALCRELDQADFHASCLHGSVVVLEMPLLELERRASGPKKLTEDR